MKYFAHVLVVVIAAATTLAGCGGPAEPSKPKIGYSAMTLKNPFFKIIADSITEEAEKHGYEVIVNDAERQVKAQSDQIDNFIAQKVTAIVINPVDRIAVGPAIKRANEAGIPVFTNDLQCVAEGAEIAGHIGTDNFQGGELAGEAMIEALGEGGGEVLVLHFKQANSCVLRVDGFKKVIDAYNEGRDSGQIKIVKELDGGGLHREGFEATQAALKSNQNLAGIFAINDPSAIGAYDAIEADGKQDQVTIIGFDGQIDGKQAILDGRIYADPIQFPKKMGVSTVQNIIKHLEGEEFKTVDLIPTAIYKKADAEKDPELKSVKDDSDDEDSDDSDT